MNQLTKVTPEIESGIQKLEGWSQSLVVKNNDDRLIGMDAIKQVKTQTKIIVDFFADSKKKTHEAWKAVVASEKYFTDRLNKIESVVKQAVLKYDREQEEIRRAEQARLQAKAEEEARRERERLMKRAENLKTPELKQEAMEAAESVVTTVVEVESNVEKADGESYQSIWKFRIVDESQIPREYLIVNEKALSSIAKSTKGSLKIPGVEFYEDKILKVRI